MSVPKSKRNEAEPEYVYAARELEMYTIRKCIGFPKRYTFYLGQQMAQMAGKIYEYVICANSIYPTSQADYQMRRSYLLKANGELRSLIAQIEVANELFGLAHEGNAPSEMGEEESVKLFHWSGLAYNEARLLKGVLKRDAKRFKDLP